MNTIINKIEKLINSTPSGENRNKLTEINIILQSQLNLCDICAHHIVTCNSIGIIWGNGRGNDNVIKCKTYKYAK